jgi:DNA modification methylase
MGHILRHVYECFAVLPMNGFQRTLTDEPDLWRVQWTPGNRETGHAAEKPIELYRRALRLVAAPGALVVDPFAGSGTTIVAALLEGMDAIGIERDADSVECARARCANVEAGNPPSPRPLAQVALAL